ncbi:enoyl-CoA hydratase-related protein [Rhodococcus sp. IEGM 1381]|uniref:enoyl-CoA hydratase/isomerase family protein n=1 Tax=Rhodococcus sp. IEGM 1381 TaxID=3047085 RepID=UPI0024B6DD81|nr:enoyl-CoA hydratase-related protein [Rhodococcus sp. IEGM 1381]MDI9893898.1 enoyl-CoA hydratase-related protein [Rhodococcus sp. IEGM 1381]
MPTESSPVLSFPHRAVAQITLSNPPVNALTRPATRRLHAVLRELARDATIRAVVITGERVFSAGSDISEMPEMQKDGDVLARKSTFENATLDLLAELPLPTVAAVDGFALGGGLEMALCCDLVVADAGAQLGLPEIDLGVIPSSGGSMRALRRVGQARAAELVLLGEPIAAETALEWGLINRVAPRGASLSVALDLAQTLARKSRSAVHANKRALELTFGPSPYEPARRALPVFEEAFGSPDGREGVRAFLAKESPRFR